MTLKLHVKYKKNKQFTMRGWLVTDFKSHCKAEFKAYMLPFLINDNSITFFFKKLQFISAVVLKGLHVVTDVFMRNFTVFKIDSNNK